MIPELLEERAALYVSGAMLAQEREQFELVLEFHTELRDLVASLTEIGVAMMQAATPLSGVQSSAGLKARILGAIAGRPQASSSDSLVVSDPAGFVQWINPAFSAMCGYTIEELRGRKLGPILQGEKTDLETAERMRRAVHEHRPCQESILNYHKNGAAYWVEIKITPILDDAGQPLWLIAKERELADQVAA